MNINLQNLSLRQLVTVILAGFVILAVIHFLVTAGYQRALHHAAEERQAATRLEHLSSQLKIVSQLNPENKNTKEELEAILVNFETALGHFAGKEDSLQHLYLNGKEIWANTKASITTLLDEPPYVDTLVTETRPVALDDGSGKTILESSQKVLSIANPNFIKAGNHILRSSEKLSLLGQKFKAHQMAVYAKKDQDLTTISLIFLALIFASAAILLVATYKHVFDPLNTLNQVIDRLRKGDVSESSDYSYNNEIGEMARSVNQIAVNLQSAASFVKNIEAGNLDSEFDGLDKRDLHEHSLENALLAMRDQMKKVEQEEQERTWSTGGLAKFVEILRSGDDDVHTLGDLIISNLVSYTKSNQGGIYLLNDEEENNQFLELISLYAFNTKKFDKRTFRPGESLVGQTFLERESIYLLEIPHDYITITSGLGGANPKAILLVPLKVNDIIYGVLELASFNEFKDYEIKFVEKLAESIASTIAGAKNNERTKALLEESQALTEQMQAQEEEMRQNMEELSATQEEMARKEVEMTAQLTAINNSLASAEFDLDGHLLKANDNYASMMGYSNSDDLAGFAFAAFSGGDHHQLWHDLRNGLSRSGDFIKIRKSGEEFPVNATYTPVKNSSGHYYKVIELILSSDSLKDKTAESPGMKEVEDALRQNLEELEITQEQLDQKLQQCEVTLRTLDDVVKIVTADVNGRIISLNNAVALQTGFEKGEMKNRYLIELFEEDLSNSPVKASETSLTLKGKSRKKRITAELRLEDDTMHIIWI